MSADEIKRAVGVLLRYGTALPDGEQLELAGLVRRCYTADGYGVLVYPLGIGVGDVWQTVHHGVGPDGASFCFFIQRLR